MQNKSKTYRFGSWMLRHRFPILALILILTVIFGYFATRVSLKNPTIDLFPKNHPYVETYVQYEDIFGGANIVIIALQVKEGDIFNVETLKKIKTITKALEFLPAVNNYQVLSIAQRKIKKTVVHDVEGFVSDPIMWPEIPETEEQIAALRRSIYTTGRLHGSLVSLDDKSALIVAGFFERGLVSPAAPLREVITAMAESNKQDPNESLKVISAVADNAVWSLDDTLYDAIDKIVSAQEDGNTETFMIGRPILLGQIYKRFPQLYWIFLATVLSIIGVLFIYFRDIRGVTIPVITALISACWGVGFLGMLGYDFNPLVIVVPFIISARALSHSVQLIERYLEELEATGGDRTEASILTFSNLFKPGMLSIITDAAGVFIVILTPIPLMEKLALMGSFWVLSIIVSDVIFNPIFLSFFPTPKIHQSDKITGMDRLLAAIGRATYGKARIPILVTTGIVFVIGAFFAKDLVIGDVHPGTPLLWPSSHYNRDTADIGEMFGNTEMMSVIVEGKYKNAIKNPKVLRTMEGLQRKLESLDEVTTTSSIADMVPEITKIMHGGNPRWELIPQEPREAGFYLEMIFSGAEPGDLARFITNDFKDGNITVYLKDHKGETLRAVVAAAKEFIRDHPIENAEILISTYKVNGPLEHFDKTITDREQKDKAELYIQRYIDIHPADDPSVKSADYLAGLLAAIQETDLGENVKTAIKQSIDQFNSKSDVSNSEAFLDGYLVGFMEAAADEGRSSKAVSEKALGFLSNHIDAHPVTGLKVRFIDYLNDLEASMDSSTARYEKRINKKIRSIVKQYIDPESKFSVDNQYDELNLAFKAGWEQASTDSIEDIKKSVLNTFRPYLDMAGGEQAEKQFAAKLDKVLPGIQPAIVEHMAMAYLKDYLSNHPAENSRLRMAGNYGGLLAAVNEAIVRSEAKVAIMAFVLVFLFCGLAYRSFWAGVIFLIPILISNYLTYALMGALGIGLDVNALPVVSLGVGLGVDYGLYILGRVEEEYAINPDIEAATAKAIATAGRAVLFTASTMVAGIIFWAFSFLRFQAEMGILLAFWMIVSMLGGLVLLPTLVVMTKPKFITKGR